MSRSLIISHPALTSTPRSAGLLDVEDDRRGGLKCKRIRWFNRQTFTPKEAMLGAIVGDVTGSIYECRRIRTKDFELFSHDSCFTDDTVLTVAIADAILQGT